MRGSNLKARDLAEGVALAAVAVVVAGAFLPWGRSGAARRTSFELVSVADRFGLLPGSLAGLAPLWFAVPALAGVAALLLASHRGALATTICAAVGALGVAAAILTYRSPLLVEPGATITAVGGAVAILSAGARLVAGSGRDDR